MKARLLFLLITWSFGAAVYGQITMQDLQKQVGIDQRLGDQIPLDLTFRDEANKSVPLGAYFGQRPVVLALVYYQCPMLCNQVLNGLVMALKAMKLNIGQDFEVVLVSIDPRETPELAVRKKQAYIRVYNRPGAAEGWHFMTGEQKNIAALARAVGFRYRYDKVKDQFAHAAGIMVLTPRGKLSQYFYGIEYSARDLRLALVDSSQNKIGNIVDRIILYCFLYDPFTGKYGFAIMRALRLLGILTILILGTFIFVMVRRERRGTLQRDKK